MIYVQFFQASAIDASKLVEACGDRSVVILDGRTGMVSRCAQAKHECAKRGYKAWQIHSGESFTRSSPITQMHKLEN